MLRVVFTQALSKAGSGTSHGGPRLKDFKMVTVELSTKRGAFLSTGREGNKIRRRCRAL